MKFFFSWFQRPVTISLAASWSRPTSIFLRALSAYSELGNLRVTSSSAAIARSVRVWSRDTSGIWSKKEAPIRYCA